MRKVWTLMPTRLVREGILDSLLVNALSDSAEILYRRLMSIVDDYGRFEADTDLIRARCFPRQFDRWSRERISESIRELQFPTVKNREEPLVTVYSCGLKKYLQINNFGQRIQSNPRYPGPDASDATVEDGGSPPYSESDTYSKTNTNAAKTAADMVSIPEWFASVFWPSWIKAANDSKGAALKALRSKAKTEKDRTEIMAGLKSQSALRLATDPKFRSHASTWINQGRWSDEPTNGHPQLDLSGAEGHKNPGLTGDDW